MYDTTRLAPVWKICELAELHSWERVLWWLEAYLPEETLDGFIEDINGFHARNANDLAACGSIIEYQDDLKRRAE